MDNKTMLEGILWDLKVLSDLCLHGSIESGTKNVHTTFTSALNDILIMQNDLFNNMNENGMYNITKVDTNKIAQTKAKYEPKLEEN